MIADPHSTAAAASIDKACSVDECVRKPRSTGICDFHQRRMRLKGTYDDPASTARRDEQRAALAKAATDEAKQPGACWIWPGRRTTSGYGFVTEGARVIASRQASRNAYVVAYGAIPDGLFACHHCDTPDCYRPSHLFLGTHADNMHDMAAKGRGRSLSGSEHPFARLTPDDVRELLRLRSLGWTQYQLADHFRVRQQLVSSLLNGKTGYLREVTS